MKFEVVIFNQQQVVFVHLSTSLVTIATTHVVGAIAIVDVSIIVKHCFSNGSFIVDDDC